MDGNEINPTNGSIAMLRGCFIRAAAWSALAGALFGAGYVMLEVGRGYGLGTLLASATWTGFQMLIGAVQGALGGLLIGSVIGLVLVWATLVGAFPRRPAYRHIRIVGAVSAATGLVCLGIVLQVVGLFSRLLAIGIGDVILWFAYAGLAGWWVGTHVACWRIIPDGS
jgi:hypothetical protein